MWTYTDINKGLMTLGCLLQRGPFIPYSHCSRADMVARSDQQDLLSVIGKEYTYIQYIQLRNRWAAAGWWPRAGSIFNTHVPVILFANVRLAVWCHDESYIRSSHCTHAQIVCCLISETSDITLLICNHIRSSQFSHTQIWIALSNLRPTERHTDTRSPYCISRLTDTEISV